SPRGRCPGCTGRRGPAAIGAYTRGADPGPAPADAMGEQRLCLGPVQGRRHAAIRQQWHGIVERPGDPPRAAIRNHAHHPARDNTLTYMQASPSVANSRAQASIAWLLSTCCFASIASMRACDTLLPALATEFSVTVGQAARVIFVFAVASGVFQLCFGPLGDRYGKLRIIALCALACVIRHAAAFC